MSTGCVLAAIGDGRVTCLGSQVLFDVGDAASRGVGCRANGLVHPFTQDVQTQRGRQIKESDTLGAARRQLRHASRACAAHNGPVSTLPVGFGGIFLCGANSLSEQSRGEMGGRGEDGAARASPKAPAAPRRRRPLSPAPAVDAPSAPASKSPRNRSAVEGGARRSPAAPCWCLRDNRRVAATAALLALGCYANAMQVCARASKRALWGARWW